LIATGLRWGEVAALRWADVDLEEAALTVRRALKETREFVITKSKGGRRRIDLPPSVVLELRRHRKKKWKPDDLVFRTENGEPLHASNLARRHLFPILACAKLRRIRFHDLRHTATAIRLLAGQHPLVVKKLLGHSSVKTTMDVYGQLQASVSKDAAAQYEAAMKAPKRRRAASPK
jgi:integrase